MNLSAYFPLPFTCLHERYQAGAQDDHGDVIAGWSTPVPVACSWQPAASNRILTDESVTTEQTTADLTLFVQSALEVDHRDRFTVDGRKFEVVGLPKDYDHGPFGFAPNRLVIELKWVG